MRAAVAAPPLECVVDKLDLMPERPSDDAVVQKILGVGTIEELRERLERFILDAERDGLGLTDLLSLRDRCVQRIEMLAARRARLKRRSRDDEPRAPRQFNGNQRGANTTDGVQRNNPIEESADLARPIRVVVSSQTIPASPRTKEDVARLKQWIAGKVGQGMPRRTAGDYDAFVASHAGQVELRVHASGEWMFVVNEGDVRNLVKGGLVGRVRKRVVDRWDDLTRMTGPYHGGARKWDSYIVPFATEDGGFIYVGYGGAMEQPRKMGGQGKVARVREGHNFSRDRHAFAVTRDDKGVETWIDLGSLAGSEPTIDGKGTGVGLDGGWNQPAGRVGPDGQIKREHRHGYGGRPLQAEDGTALSYDSTYWMIYEDVIQYDVVRADGTIERLPWKTRMVAQRMKTPYRLYDEGELLPDGRRVEAPIALFDPFHDPATGALRPNSFPATDRGGWANLFEGMNPSWGTVKIGPEEFWIGIGSGGNYVDGGGAERDYGVSMVFRPKSEGPIGRWYPVLNERGDDLAVFSRGFERIHNLSWFGRGDLFPYTQDGKQLWYLLAHGIDLSTLPKDFPRSGWPSPDQFEMAFRNGYIIPVELSTRPAPFLGPARRMPWLKFVDPPPVFVERAPPAPSIVTDAASGAIVEVRPRSAAPPGSPPSSRGFGSRIALALWRRGYAVGPSDITVRFTRSQSARARATVVRAVIRALNDAFDLRLSAIEQARLGLGLEPWSRWVSRR